MSVRDNAVTSASDLAILVNSTDSFEDCWDPFFRLFKTFWPDYSGQIFLNTETKDYSFDGLQIKVVKSGLTEGSWSECLAFAIEFMNVDQFLYLQEDYFLRDSVSQDSIFEIFSIFKSLNVDCLHLTDQCTTGPFSEFDGDDRFWLVDEGAPYRVSTQAAIWSSDSILSLLRPWETGWEFEHNATKRALRSAIQVICLRQDYYGVGKLELMPYIFTGVIKGKWNRAVETLFLEHGIDLDLRQRGFWDGAICSFGTRLKGRFYRTYRILANELRNMSFECRGERRNG